MREFGSEFPAFPLDTGYFDKIKNLGADMVLLRSGRDAMAYAASEIAPQGNIILLPAYCCESMISPFTNNGWKVYFYPLNNDLTADKDEVLRLVAERKPLAVLLMNYFGIAATNDIADIIKEIDKNIFIIEDCTHSLFGIHDNYNPEVDYYVASIRKWMGVNDGALVLSKSAMKSVGYKANDFVFKRRAAQEKKMNYLLNKNSFEKVEYRMLLAEAEASLNDNDIIGISPESEQRLRLLNFNELRAVRYSNYHNLYNKIKYMPGIRFPENVGKPDVKTPFSLPVLVKNRDRVQSKLAEYGLYAPVLWPVNKDAGYICNITKEMSENMLSLPVDQRYNYDDMETVAEILSKVAGKL